MPLDVDEPLRERIEQLEQELALFIDNFPTTRFLGSDLHDKGMRHVNPSPLTVLERRKTPAGQRKKAKRVEKADLKPAETGQPSARRQRLANLTPCLAHFAELGECAAGRRRAGALQLLRHLQAAATNDKDEVDEENEVTEYCAKRLVRGCCHAEATIRLGSTLTLAVLLKECPRIKPAWLFELGRRILSGHAHQHQRDVAWGRALLCAALLVSGRAFDAEGCQKVVLALLDLRRYDVVRQFLAQQLGYLIRHARPAVVITHVWGKLREGLATPSNYTPELLYLALQFQAKFQGKSAEATVPPDLKKLLKLNLWSEAHLAELRPTFLETVYEHHPQVHIVWQALLPAVFTSSEDEAVVAANVKRVWRVLVQDVPKEGRLWPLVLHVQKAVAQPAVAAVENMADEACRNDVLYDLYRGRRSFLERGLMRLAKDHKRPLPPLDSVIRQFLHVAELGPEDAADVTPSTQGRRWAKKGRKGPRAPQSPGEPAPFAAFRTLIQRYCLHTVRLHVEASPDAAEEVIAFCMTAGLFYVPSHLDRREVLRRGDVGREMTADLLDCLANVLQLHTGFRPRAMVDAMRLLGEKEAAYETRYDPLEEGSSLAKARAALLRAGESLAQRVPEQLRKPGVFSTPQAFLRLVGHAFFYVSVIQDEGAADLLLDVCAHCEAHAEDLAGDMDSLIDLLLGLLLYHVDFEAKSYRAIHLFKLVQQGALAVFRSTCAQLTTVGLARMLEALKDPLEVLEVEGATLEGENDEDEDEEGEEEEDEEQGGKEESGGDDAEADQEDSASEEEEDEEEGDVMDVGAGMGMDIDEQQMALVLRAHKVVAERRTQQGEKLLRREELATAVRTKILDMVLIYSAVCKRAGALVQVAAPLPKLLLQELRGIEGNRKNRKKRQLTNKFVPEKSPDLFTKMRAVIRTVLKTNPTPEPDELETFAETCYTTLEFSGRVIRAIPFAQEADLLKADLLAFSIWLIAALLNGAGVAKLAIDRDRVRAALLGMFAGKQVSMRVETVLHEVLQECLQRFQSVYSGFIIPALCDALVTKAAAEVGSAHPHTKVVLLKSLDTAVQYILPKSALEGVEHVTLLKSMMAIFESAPQLDLNESGVPLLVNLTMVCVRWDRKGVLRDAAGKVWRQYKDYDTQDPRMRLNLKYLALHAGGKEGAAWVERLGKRHASPGPSAPRKKARGPKRAAEAPPGPA